MYYVYRYTDLSDGIIKYVGIVYSKPRTLKQRVVEHLIDSWCDRRNYNYKVEYFTEGLNSRTDCEVWESHLIAKYQTYKWNNISKADWGLATCLVGKEDEIKWKEFKLFEIPKPDYIVGICKDNHMFSMIYSKVSSCSGKQHQYKSLWNNLNEAFKLIDESYGDISFTPRTQTERLAVDIYCKANKYLLDHGYVRMSNLEEIMPEIELRYEELLNNVEEREQRYKLLMSAIS